MLLPLRRRSLPLMLLASILVSACGGGGGDSAAPASRAVTTIAIQEPGAPTVTGNTALDGINWFNFRRQQLGLSTLTRSNTLDASAQGHSNYQAINGVISHVQTMGMPGFTGASLANRLAAAGYNFTQGSHAYGEVISSTSSTSGVYAAEGLITAIYHRFVILEPMFKEIGAGTAVSAGGYTYFTTNFGANGLETGLGKGNIVTYPFKDQLRVPRNFFSDDELPDPVPGKNEVGFPISIHADILATVTVQSFTVQPRGGASLPVQLLARANDAKTPTSVAAIVPLDPLTAGTTYDVQFAGTVNGVNVTRSWSFTTQ
ncbi:CAP domain-containing protein [Noviherbaspirillum cavernae]|uniref:CAP domain-containing protein n=1 Tax=Noviherbaspirillum cavernae TaxID=2320862 RepID=A0A418WWY5_9BURK|nr:CAP domain-containing protein [Noviherbaspirillum cavernae]RJG04633.1 CAP domain-containing protein [Noviherbaspirillum cavernae]